MTTINKPLGIYVHIPFCVRKCPYCGFYSIPIKGEEHVNQDIIEVYMSRINTEIKRFAEMYSSDRIVDSIFFGGGTPTAIDIDSIIVTLNNIKDFFKVPLDCEITVEVNPGTLENQKVDLTKLKEAGVNRLSIGVQSFDDGTLKILGRIHSAGEAEEMIRSAREAGFDNINIDLMFGIPGQSHTDWERTLRKAMEIRPEHVSFYSLQIEEGTVYWDRFQKGDLMELPDDINRAMYHRAINVLKSNGYHHYEISNASFPGFECRHNLKYWTLKEYLGIGPSASSYMEGRRFTFAPDIDLFLGEAAAAEHGEVASAEHGEAAWEAWENKLSENHENSQFDDMSEYTFTGLRLTKGIDYGEFKSRFGKSFRDVFQDRWDELEEFFESGALVELVYLDGTPMVLRLTEKGIDISNRIMAVFV